MIVLVWLALMATLVTGGSGFIGKHLVQHLLTQSKKEKIVCVGRVPLGIAEVEDAVFDLGDEAQTRELIFSLRPTQIYHLAGMARISPNYKLPDYFAANTQTTFSLLKAIKESKLAVRFFLASSMHVYGNQTEIVDEATPPRPESPYAFTKFLAEQMVRHYANELKESYFVIGRLYSCFGPGQPEGFVAADLIQRVLSLPNEPNAVLKVGPLNTYRRFLDVRDMVKILPQLLSQKTGSNLETYAIASPHELEIKKMLEIILAITKRSPKIESTTQTANVFRGLRVNAKKLFGVVPENNFRPIELTLTDMVKHVQNQ